MRQNEFQGISEGTRKLLEGQESRRVDFKTDPGAIDADDLVAFANAEGGTILAGVAETAEESGIQRGTIVGCEVSDGMKQSIMGKASSCRPSIDIRITVENSGNPLPIMRVDIPEGELKPYCTSSGTYKIRSEGRNAAIDPPLMRAMILESEVDEFVQRFKHAGNELLFEIKRVETDLAAQIVQVREAAKSAIRSSEKAEAAAHEAAAVAATAAGKISSDI